MDFANINHNTALFEYLPIIFFLIIACGIVSLALISSFIMVPKNPYKAKNDPYECGFEAMDTTNKQFDVKFYLIAVLFVIFDIEIIFMYPWVMSLAVLSNVGFFAMMIFIAILTLGFVYEWKKGAISWN
jgi:NADH-quinone oxidoreductase subunit A